MYFYYLTEKKNPQRNKSITSFFQKRILKNNIDRERQKRMMINKIKKAESAGLIKLIF